MPDLSVQAFMSLTACRQWRLCPWQLAVVTPSGVRQGVGKSCLVLRYVRGQFDESSKVTVGAAFMSHSIQTQDGTVVKFEIWCAGPPLRTWR